METFSYALIISIKKACGGKFVVGDFFLCLLFGWLSFILSFAIANHSQLDEEKKEFLVI